MRRKALEICILLCLSRLKTGIDLVTSLDTKYPDLASTRLRMHNGSLESCFKKVADLHAGFTGYEWTRRDLNQIVNTKRMKPDRWREIWKFDENSLVAFGNLISSTKSLCLNSRVTENWQRGIVISDAASGKE